MSNKKNENNSKPQTNQEAFPELGKFLTGEYRTEAKRIIDSVKDLNNKLIVETENYYKKLLEKPFIILIDKRDGDREFYQFFGADLQKARFRDYTYSYLADNGLSIRLIFKRLTKELNTTFPIPDPNIRDDYNINVNLCTLFDPLEEDDKTKYYEDFEIIRFDSIDEMQLYLKLNM